MKIYNTLVGKKQKFEPVNQGVVNMYLCGPTVYAPAHLGHGRSSVAFDIIRRYLMFKSYKVRFASNYTDIDDKMIKNAKEKKLTVKQLAESVIPLYEKDYRNLNVLPPDYQPRATQYIDSIIELIQKLEKNNSVYELNDGIYFDISTFPEYGKLSKQKLEELQMGARVAVNEEKRNPQDFALWKKAKPEEPSWESPWGKGRPGWHIECSAMSMSLLGETLDIHAGGADLVFPHHECEVAQSEKATGKMFAKYWMHNGFININEEKMSKSLGNIISLQYLIKKHGGEIIRFLYLQTHYRSPINFTNSLISQSKNSLERIHGFVRNLECEKQNGNLNEQIKKIISASQKKFVLCMDDDFDTPGALASLYELIKNINIYQEKIPLNKADQKALIEYLHDIDDVFGVIFPKKEVVGEEIQDLIKKREIARNKKDYLKADEIRKLLEEKGILVEDTSEGTIWKKAD